MCSLVYKCQEIYIKQSHHWLAGAWVVLLFGVGMSFMSGCTSCITLWMSLRRNNMGCMPLCPMQLPVVVHNWLISNSTRLKITKNRKVNHKVYTLLWRNPSQLGRHLLCHHDPKRWLSCQMMLRRILPLRVLLGQRGIVVFRVVQH